MKDVAGRWIGWGYGDAGPIVATAKIKLRAKFSYAKNLDSSETFDQALQFVLSTYQTRKNMDGYTPPLRTDGVLDYATQLSLGLVSVAAPEKPILFTAQGTGVDMFTGYPADTARALLDMYQWQPIGNWPATAFPMQQSYDAGIAELIVQVRNWCPRVGKRKCALAGYSQGAIVTAMFFKRHVQPVGAEFHYLIEQDRIIGAVTWGNPCRERGVARGNDYAGWPTDDSGGIGDELMHDTPVWWLDFAHTANSPWGRDIYTATPFNATGTDMRAIWPIVKNVDFAKLFARLGAVLTNPTVELYAAAQAVLYAGMFFLSNPPTLAHINYDPQPAIDYLRSAANTTTAHAA